MVDIEVTAATELTDEFLDLYGAVYAEPPYDDGPDEVAEFAAAWPRIAGEPGFRLVLARDEGALVGFTVGYVLRPDCGWWPREHLSDFAPGDVEEWIGADGVGRSVGVDELGVRSGWRRRGLARALHDALVVGRRESRVVLWARVDAPVARAVYARWGYRDAARVSLPDGRSYVVMCLDRG